jgi:hypothetical protein
MDYPSEYLTFGSKPIEKRLNSHKKATIRVTQLGRKTNAVCSHIGILIIVLC